MTRVLETVLLGGPGRGLGLCRVGGAEVHPQGAVAGREAQSGGALCAVQVEQAADPVEVFAAEQHVEQFGLVLADQLGVVGVGLRVVEQHPTGGEPDLAGRERRGPGRFGGPLGYRLGGAVPGRRSPRGRRP
ncbi:hypothetical protein IHE61_30105 [Streptomyces sp. GKU 257-1]|nr:hypothetical protein [Streptomyces sp. GKU 257-1]